MKTRGRHNLNTVEAVIVWAIGAWGGEVDLLEWLSEEAGQAMATSVEYVETLTEESRRELLDRWRSQDLDEEAWERRLSLAEQVNHSSQACPRWIRVRRALLAEEADGVASGEANPKMLGVVRRLALMGVDEASVPVREDLRLEGAFDFAWLGDLEPQAFNRFARELGLYQFVELARSHERRKLARLRRRLRAAERAVFDKYLASERDVQRLELVRLREVFWAICQVESELALRLEQLGLYSIATAAEDRFERRLHRLARRLPHAIGDRLIYFQRQNRAGSRRGLGPLFLRSLTEFTARWRRQRKEGTEEDDDGGLRTNRERL